MMRIGPVIAVTLFSAMLLTVLYLAKDNTEPAAQAQVGAATEEGDTVVVGGVRRPSTDVQPVDTTDLPPATSPYDPGKMERIDPNANIHVRSVVEAAREKKLPERLSVLHQPRPFNLQEYLLNKPAYLDVVEPGRVFQPAQPAIGVSRLEALSSRRHKINQGESVPLSAKTLPDMPVTFTSFDLGAFENKLTSITVAADATGVATAVFTGTPGTYNDVHILAASPVSSGQAKFIIHVVPPAAAQ